MGARKPAVAFIFVTVLIDAIGLGLLVPVLPDVLRRFSSEPTFVSTYFGWFIGTYAFMQFVASPVLGSLSDRYGRRSILLGSLLGAGLDYLFMAYAPTLPLLFLGRAISGLTGASLTVAGSYMADISDDSNRSANFGMIGAAWGVGFVVGPTIGGLLGALSPKAPFLGAACLSLANFSYGLFVLPESLPKERRRQVSWAGLNPFGSVARILAPSEFVGFVWVYFLVFLAGQVNPVNWTLYTQTKFGWSAWQVGLSLSAVGVMIAISHGGMTRVLVPRLGEHRALTLGLSCFALVFLLIAFAWEAALLYAAILLFAVTGITMPSLHSILARHTPPDRQGELQGSLVSLGSLACVLAPAVYTQAFVRFTRPGAEVYFPGAAYLTASLICLAALSVRFAAERAPSGTGAPVRAAPSPTA
jgi:MFS transporter, DHA1 family, tetracycline resistance protein